MEILIQSKAIKVADIYQRLLQRSSQKAGAVVTFTGLVRDMNEGVHVNTLFIEHYPGMTEKILSEIAAEAELRWQLDDIVVVHRVGAMKPSDVIVFVGVSSCHRGDSFLACEFLMDFLKTRAPFWKKENIDDPDRQTVWLEERDSDLERAARWLKSSEN